MINKTAPPCASTCNRTHQLLTTLKMFLNFSKIPLLSLMEEAVKFCQLQQFSKPQYCLAENTNSNGSTPHPWALFNTTQQGHHGQLLDTAEFCFNTKCNSPLRFTTDENHWDKDIQKVLVYIHTSIKSKFPNSTLPLNRSILPCGIECVSIGFTDVEHRVSQVFISTFSTITVTGVIFSVFVFFFNRHTIGRHFVRRTCLLFTIFSGLATVPLMSSAQGHKKGSPIYCHADGTLITHASPTSGFLCWLSATYMTFFSMMGPGYIAALTFTWQELTKVLSQPGAASHLFSEGSQSNWWMKYRKDLITFLLASLFPIATVIVANVQNGFGAIPAFGMCFLSIERGFNSYYTWYHFAVIFPSVAFVALGVHTLVSNYGVFGALRWIKTDKHPPHITSSNQAGRNHQEASLEGNKKKSLEGLVRFSRQLLLYLFLGGLSLTAILLYGMRFELNVNSWREQAKRHVLCVLTSCSPAACPPLPRPPVALYIIPLLTTFVCIFMISTWAFSPSFLINVPGVRVLVMKYQQVGRDRMSDAVRSGSSTDQAALTQSSKSDGPSTEPEPRQLSTNL